MKIKEIFEKNLIEEFKDFILRDYEGANNGQNDDLTNMIVDDFIDSLNDYNEDNELIDIINDVTGNTNGSYNCNTYESADIICENIYEFNSICREMLENGIEFDITETEINLAKVLYYILENVLLANGYTKIQDILDNFEKEIK